MKILVTGGTGFVGRGVVEGLDREEVVSFSRAEGDFGSPEVVREYLEGVNTVVHLAWTSVPSSFTDTPEDDVHQNVIGSLRLMAECISAGVERIVFMSSGGTVYGQPRSLPICENHTVEPISSYGITKLAVERYLMSYAKSAGIKSVVLRGSNAYGPGHNVSKDQGVVGTWLRCLKDEKPIVLYGDGMVVRDYVYVTDFSAAVVKAVRSSNEGVFNIGSGIGHTLNEVLDTIVTVTGENPEIRRLPSRGFDVPRNVLDNRLAGEQLGWEPTISLEEGVRRTWVSMTSTAEN